MQMTWSEKFEHKGRLKGRREGRREALEEGVRNLRRVVLRLLDQRFGRVPVSIRRKVEKIDSMDQLAELAEKVLAVQSLDEMGLGNGAVKARL